MPRRLQVILNEANPNVLAFAEKDLPLGNALGNVTANRAGVITGTFVLPDTAKALAVLFAYARVGGTTGVLTPADPGAAPLAGEVGVNAEGDISTFAGDAITDIEVHYEPVEGLVFTEQVQVTASVGTLLATRRGAVLISANITEGLDLGPVAILARGTAATANSASLDDAGSGVTFDATDVIAGVAILVYVAQPGEGTGVPDAVNVALNTDFDY